MPRDVTYTRSLDQSDAQVRSRMAAAGPGRGLEGAAALQGE